MDVKGEILFTTF